MARKPWFLAGAVALVAAAPAHAIAPKNTPDCVKPGAQFTGENSFSSTSGTPYATAEMVLAPEVWNGDDGVESLPETSFITMPRGPVTNTPNPTIKGLFDPKWTQVLTLPPTVKVGSAPLVGYKTSINPYNANGTVYSNADTYAAVYPDIKAIYLAQKSIKASRNQRVAYLVRGFRTAQTYAHAVGPGKTKHIKLRRGQGDDTCGRAGGLLPLAGLKPGSYKIVVNTSRKGTSGGVSASLQIKR